MWTTAVIIIPPQTPFIQKLNYLPNKGTAALHVSGIILAAFLTTRGLSTLQCITLWKHPQLSLQLIQARGFYSNTHALYICIHKTNYKTTERRSYPTAHKYAQKHTHTNSVSRTAMSQCTSPITLNKPDPGDFITRSSSPQWAKTTLHNMCPISQGLVVLWCRPNTMGGLEL